MLTMHTKYVTDIEWYHTFLLTVILVNYKYINDIEIFYSKEMSFNMNNLLGMKEKLYSWA